MFEAIMVHPLADASDLNGEILTCTGNEDPFFLIAVV